MPAYSLPIEKHRCDSHACPGWATQTVYNGANAKMGHYCSHHARALIQALNERDQ